MPRLTDATYLTQRHHLMAVWNYRPWLLTKLEGFEQRDLHRFFAISHEMSDDDALAYRQDVSAKESSLPSQAGRAYTHLVRVMKEDSERRANPPVATVRPAGSPKPKQIVNVTGLANPEVDTMRLARMLVKFSMSPEFDGVYERIKQKDARLAKGIRKGDDE